MASWADWLRERRGGAIRAGGLDAVGTVTIDPPIGRLVGARNTALPETGQGAGLRGAPSDRYGQKVSSAYPTPCCISRPASLVCHDPRMVVRPLRECRLIYRQGSGEPDGPVSETERRVS